MSSSRKDVIVRHTRKFHTNTNHRPKERDAQRAVRSHEPSICDTNSRLECYPLIQAQTQDTADLVQNSIAHGIPGSDFISPPALSNIDFLADEIPMLQGIGLHNDLVLESFGLERLDRSCTGTPSTEDRLISVCHNGFHSMLDQIGKDYRGGSRFLRSHDRPKTTDYQFTLTDEDYAMAQKNLTSILSSQKSLDVWFPSKYTMMRFVRAFFDHMAPHMPIVHQPTFNIAFVERKFHSFTYLKPLRTISSEMRQFCLKICSSSAHRNYGMRRLISKRERECCETSQKRGSDDTRGRSKRATALWISQ